MAELNETIHQPARLRIMASLVSLEDGVELDFVYLRELLQLTNGNLGAHLKKLEEAKLVRVKKTFVSSKPRTYLSATTKGRRAFEEHVEALKEIVGN